MLKLSSDRKTSPLSSWEKGKARWVPKVRNAFGLPAVDSCPGATDACKAVCYADRVPYPSVDRLLRSNFEQLQAATTVTAKAELLADMMMEYRLEHKRWCPDLDMDFRIHWSGDFFDVSYTRAWRRTIKANADITFWVYTRSEFAIPHLADLENLSLYLSVDVDNADSMLPLAAEWDLPIAWMGEDTADMHAPRTPTCPVDAKRMPLVSDAGVGGCTACGLCIRGERPVLFPIH